MATLQVKGMDDGLYEAIKRKAQLENRSISQEVVTILQAHLSQARNGATNATDEFLKLSGSWEDDRDAKTLIDEIRSDRNTKKREERIGHAFD